MELKTKLFLHQDTAVKKLLPIKIGALYMEMGTGKTRTALEIIAARYNAGRIDKVIWLCPCSIKRDIERNIEYHADGAGGLIEYYGLESISQSTRIYGQLLNIVQTNRVFMIVDESSMVKNHLALRTQRIIALAGLCEYRMILSGTPVSRSEADLYAQWYILDKRVFGYASFWSFAANHLEYDIYGKVRRTLHVEYLSEKIAPYTYAVKKSECVELPPKNYLEKHFSLAPEQSLHYETIKDKLLAQVDDFRPETIYRLFTALQLITSGRRMLKCDPVLRHEPFFTSAGDNPRIKMLLNLLEACAGDKIIVWCKYHHEIDDILAALAGRFPDAKTAELHGRLSVKARNVQLDLFRDGADILVANKNCGGYGLNLQFCHQIIYYSNDFDWATRAQSEDRTHRIGQEYPVMIYDIVASSKIDVRIIKNLQAKKNLADQFKQELKKRREAAAGWIDGVEI